MELLNENKIVKVYSVGECHNPYYCKKIRRYGWPWNRKSKTVYRCIGWYYTEEELHKHLFEENKREDVFISDDGEVFYKAKVIICFDDGSKEEIYCDSKTCADNIVLGMKERYPNLKTMYNITMGV